MTVLVVVSVDEARSGCLVAHGQHGAIRTASAVIDQRSVAGARRTVQPNHPREPAGGQPRRHHLAGGLQTNRVGGQRRPSSRAHRTVADDPSRPGAPGPRRGSELCQGPADQRRRRRSDPAIVIAGCADGPATGAPGCLDEVCQSWLCATTTDGSESDRLVITSGRQAQPLVAGGHDAESNQGEGRAKAGGAVAKSLRCR